MALGLSDGLFVSASRQTIPHITYKISLLVVERKHKACIKSPKIVSPIPSIQDNVADKSVNHPTITKMSQNLAQIVFTYKYFVCFRLCLFRLARFTSDCVSPFQFHVSMGLIRRAQDYRIVVIFNIHLYHLLSVLASDSWRQTLSCTGWKIE